MSDQITLWTMARSAAEAVEAAKVQARAEGWRVLTVAKVVCRAAGAGHTPAWNVTLAVRPIAPFGPPPDEAAS